MYTALHIMLYSVQKLAKRILEYTFLKKGVTVSDNVVSIFSKREAADIIDLPTKEDVSGTLEDIMKKNKENEERIKKERARNNASVTRNYRLKGRKK